MPKGYEQLTLSNRIQIFSLKEIGFTQSFIAKQLGISQSTISRELARHSSRYHGYCPYFAQRRHLMKIFFARCGRKKLTGKLLDLVVEKLFLEWSPEQISGRLLLEYGLNISHETIYKYIWQDKLQGGCLYKQLRHGNKRYKKRKAVNKRGVIPNRVDIDERPSIVEEKSRIGDWEADTIIGAHHKCAILSLVDRKSKLVKLKKLEARTALNVSEEIIKQLSPWKAKVHTITQDNGLEFARHEQAASALKASTYFAKPYHSWERGLNEHTNGLVRQYFPKKMKFDNISNANVQFVENRLNNRPRKILGYKTPLEVFFNNSPPLYALLT